MFENVVAIIFQSVFFAKKCVKIIFFLFFSKLFLTLAYKNNMKTQKKKYFEANKKKDKKLIFFKSTFET